MSGRRSRSRRGPCPDEISLVRAVDAGSHGTELIRSGTVDYPIAVANRHCQNCS